MARLIPIRHLLIVDLRMRPDQGSRQGQQGWRGRRVERDAIAAIVQDENHTPMADSGRNTQ